MSINTNRIAVIAILCSGVVGCGRASFSGTNARAVGTSSQPAPASEPKPEKKPEAKPDQGESRPSKRVVVDPPAKVSPAPKDAVVQPEVDLGSAPFIDCSSLYEVPGTANPYLAMVEPGVEVKYLEGASDHSTTEAPVQVSFTDERCLAGGSRLSFSVGGGIKHGPDLPETDADGSIEEIWPHEGGPAFGKSHIVAPLNSLVGVFLGDALPSRAPEAMRFETLASRNYQELRPEIGQIFYIGNGLTAEGRHQMVVVPAGTRQFFFGIMDSHEWSNNYGRLEGSVQWQAK